uniref:Uncharacterized protein n=1 Tax=Candidatus Kentrum sp. LFY TaxID=2126342 RepID=A0A450WPX1_9GAMM|nr:MAG: hypothetical protein BECKLFY1418C_GA0070996_105311 [Candidatus Kentron sp. LFY]
MGLSSGNNDILISCSASQMSRHLQNRDFALPVLYRCFTDALGLLDDPRGRFAGDSFAEALLAWGGRPVTFGGMVTGSQRSRMGWVFR